MPNTIKEELLVNWNLVSAFASPVYSALRCLCLKEQCRIIMRDNRPEALVSFLFRQVHVLSVILHASAGCITRYRELMVDCRQSDRQVSPESLGNVILSALRIMEFLKGKRHERPENTGTLMLSK